MQKTQNAKEEVVFISVDENLICGRLSGTSREDAIEEHDRDAMTWYRSEDYIAETQCFDNACVLAIPKEMLRTDDISGEHLADLVDLELDEILEKYTIHHPDATDPEEPLDSHTHEWESHDPARGTGGGAYGSSRCVYPSCDLVQEWNTWKINPSNGEHYDWVGYRAMTDEEKESISLEA